MISIIIPAYNVSKYISDAIRSVLKQSYSQWELLIINDGSTDNTHEVISTFLNDDRIKLVDQKNQGVSATRNHGIKLAKGDYLTFLDADDSWLENNLEKKINLLSTTNDIDYVFADVFLTDEHLTIIKQKDPGTDINILNELLKWEKEVISCPSGNILIKRHCFDQGLKFDEAFSTAADQDFAISLAAGYKGRRIAEPLVKYRVLPDSMSRNIALMEKDHIAVYKKAKKNGLFGSLLFKQKCFSNLYLILAGSWWVNGGNKFRGSFFLVRSLMAYPPNISKLIKKLNA